jgi:ribonuclease HI
MVIYTDGACSLKHKLAAYGIWVPCHEYKEVQVVQDVSNNFVELGAFIRGLRYAMEHPDPDTTIVSDSMYCVGGYTEWMYNWHIPARPNAELWQVVWDLKENKGAKFTIRHCRGHGKGTNDLPEDVKNNDIIDKMVSGAMQAEIKKKLVANV